MTFLEPNILWGIPLMLIPVIIHLINRLRHRPLQWAAMQFLISANRSSTSHAKLRQWLILLCRVLAVLMLVLFLSRPLAGGWLGWALSPAPDAIVLLLDRSASMETKLSGSVETRRRHALSMLAESAKQFEGRSHFVLIDSALRTPQSVSNPSNLLELPQAVATDTAADIPAMLQAALNWLVDNRAGTTEFWIASDSQRSNWKPDDERWASIIAQLSGMQQRVRVRLLTYERGREVNTVVSLDDISRRIQNSRNEITVVVDLSRNADGSDSFPVSVALDGTQTETDVRMDGQSTRWRHQAAIADNKGGWGRIELPADANLRDNAVYFVYGPDSALKTAVVSDRTEQSRYLRLAAGVAVQGARTAVDSVTVADAGNLRWDDYALVFWQAALPSGAVADRMRIFVESGGVVICFPAGETGNSQFQGTTWGEIQSAPSEKAFQVTRWDEREGPLARTDEGQSLPVRDLVIQRRQNLTGERSVMASFEDDAPFLVRRNLGKGQIWFCATLPGPEWSTLGDGYVLVPMTQRLLAAGSRRLTGAAIATCGELSATDLAKNWATVDSSTPKDIQIQAGVYRSADRLLAVNRPEAEDDPEALETTAVTKLFGSIPLQMLTETKGQDRRVSGEIWRVFLGVMLMVLLAEAMLILPPKNAPAPLTPNSAKP